MTDNNTTTTTCHTEGCSLPATIDGLCQACWADHCDAEKWAAREELAAHEDSNA